MEDKASLIHRRGTIKRRITLFQKYFDEFDQSQDVINVKVRIDKLHEAWKNYDDIQNAIEIIDDDGAQAADQDVFESTYFQCLATGLFIIENTQNLQLRRDSTETVIAPTSVRLPKIELIKFSGNYDEWLSFKDTFLSLIHDDQSLTDLQKFHYLKSSLVGEAAQVINAFQLTGANYSLAWSLLQKKYHNIRIIT